MRWVRVFAVVVSVLVVVAATLFFARHEITRMQEDLPAFTHSAGDDSDAMVSMRDGVRLYTTIQLPDGDGPFPTVLFRNPYAQFATVFRDTQCGRFVRYGYACVLQDTRGQGGSEGEWEPGANEIGDGRDTLLWLREQSFQDGNIAMVGASYLAAVQYAAAAGGLPPEVKTLIPSVYTTDNRGVMYQDGMFRHETFTAWASMMRASNADNDSAGEDYQRALRHRPHNEVDTKIFGTAMPWYQDMIGAPAPDAPFWQREDNSMMRSVPENLNIPILMIGGWYDVFFGPQFEDWQRLASRSQSRFIIGPWTHVGSTGEAIDIDNAGGGLFQWQEMLPWLDTHLRGAAPSQDTGLKVYRMGSLEWVDEAEWPRGSDTVDYHLSALASASACDGGKLSPQPTSEEETQYRYDPENPVPTRGGAGMLAFILPGFEGALPANVLQDGLCERDDVLSFVTEPTTTPITISGKINVALEVASDAEDTAFTAKLIEVYPDGRAINIRDSITSLAYRNGATSPQAYTPGAKENITIRFWPIEWQVQPGSRLRLDISSSDFPKYNAHANVSGRWAEISDTRIATQTLFGGTLTLPLSP